MVRPGLASPLRRYNLWHHAHWLRRRGWAGHHSRYHFRRRDRTLRRAGRWNWGRDLRTLVIGNDTNERETDDYKHKGKQDHPDPFKPTWLNSNMYHIPPFLLLKSKYYK